MITSVYTNSCPNCGGPLESTRALEGLPCTKCINGSVDAFKNLPIDEKIKAIYNILVNQGNLKGYWELYYSLELYEELSNYFNKISGYTPWSLQKFWLRRLGEGASFSMSAPTGLGKSTTIMVYSSYLKDNVLYLVPTKSLQDQICYKMSKFAETSCGKIDDKKISIITINYLNRHFNEISYYRPKFIGVDDADAIVKSGKTTDKLVSIMGIPEDIYEDAIKLVRLKRLLFIQEDREELESKIRQIESKIASFSGNVAQLVIASATMRPKGVKQKALKYITGFDVSTAQIYARNIIDSFSTKGIEDIVTELGSGGLILVSKEYGKNKMKEIKNSLEDNGISADLAISGRRFLEKFSSGKTEIIIGSASYYGVAVRGIDEPKKLRYVIFYGVPKSRIKASDAVLNPFTLLKIAKLLNYEIDENKILNLNSAEIQAIKIAFLRSQKLSGKLGEIQQYLLPKIEDIRKIMASITSDIDGDTFVLKKINNEVYMEFPDATTYLQGSGRSSRLLNGGLTLGLSVILVDDYKLLEMLKRRINYLMYNFNIIDFNSLNISEVKKEIERTRNETNSAIDISTALLVVESPTKAKTISRMFGTPARRNIGGIPIYETVIVDTNKAYILDVMATKGHITDLTLDNKGYYGVDIEDERISPYYSPLYRCVNCKRLISQTVDKCPYCGSTTLLSSLSTINALRKIAMEVDKVFIATDPDTEGEKIAYDVAVNVAPYNNNIKRIKYHEVTRNGILSALRNQGALDFNAVNSQVARRIEDRWIGFELSRILKLKFNSQNQGAGRVQTPVLGWIVDNTEKYKNSMGWIANIKLGNYVYRLFFKNKSDAKITSLEVKKIGEKKDIISPYPPYTTDTLLIEAYNRFRLPAERVMKIAQELFESGLITYHRTDSIHVSSRGIEIAKEYLGKKGIGEFSARSWGNEGAHEAIRPTNPMDIDDLKKEITENPNKYFIKFTWAHFALYELIFKRFIASQMNNAIGTYTKYEINVNGNNIQVVELLSNISGGFSIVLQLRTYSLPEGKIFPEYAIIKGSKEKLMNYAEVIKLMREKNIGRPSTYAKTIQTLIRHGYIVQSKKKGYLIATKKGIEAYKYLSVRFSNLVSVDTTADLLRKMDMISNGSIEAEVIIKDILGQVKSLVSLTNSEQQI